MIAENFAETVLDLVRKSPGALSPRDIELAVANGPGNVVVQELLDRGRLVLDDHLKLREPQRSVIWSTSMMDPPWEERGSGKIKRGAQKHYPLLKTKDMPGVIRGSGLWTPAENAHLYMFVTNNFLEDGLWLVKELGFRYITNIAWTKLRPGIGRYFRGKHELLLFATRGRGWAVRTDSNSIESTVDTNDEDWSDWDGAVSAGHVMKEPGKRKHSAKPAVFYDLIESRSKGPYVEFFARSLRENWTSWGNDAAVAEPAPVETAAP